MNVLRFCETYLKIRVSSSAPPLKLTDLPGLDQRAMDESVVSPYLRTLSHDCSYKIVDSFYVAFTIN